MPQTTLYDQDRARPSAPSTCPTTLFAAPVNAAVMHQAVTAQLAGRRTGHARHQDPRRGPRRRRASRTARRAPAAPARARAARRTTAAAASVFGPHPRSYEQRLPAQMKRLALRGALTAKFGDGAIKVVDDVRARRDQDARPRRLPRRAQGRPAACWSSRPVGDENLELSARNLPTVEVILRRLAERRRPAQRRHRRSSSSRRCATGWTEVYA